MMELHNNFKMNPQAEGLSPEVSLNEVSLRPLPDSRLYYQQDGGALGLDQLRASQVQLADLQREKPFRRLLITSAVRGEGKTHVAANLSLSLTAEGLRRVLVIDADVRNPSLHLAYGIPNQFGFKDCLANQNSLWKAVLKVKDSELYIITGGIGSCSSIGPARIASVQRLLEEYGRFFDLIILDSPPLLGGVDGKLLSNVADSIIVVVGSRKAPRRLVMQAQQSIQRDKILGVILNRLDPAMACFRSYSDYDLTHTAKREKNPVGRWEKELLRGRDAKTEDLEPESDVGREPAVIPIRLHEEATREPREPLVISQNASPADREPKIATGEDPVMAASPAPPSMRDLITGAVNFDSQLLPQVEVPEREDTVPATHESTPLAQSNGHRTQDYFMTALLVSVVSLAGILGWVLGQSGARSYWRQGTDANLLTPVQSATSVRPEIEAAVPTRSAASTTTPPIAPRTPVSAASVQKASNLVPGGLVVYDNGKLVMRSDPRSAGNHAKAHSTVAKASSADPSAGTTLRIPSGASGQYLTSEVAPEYPETAREQQIQGPVVLDVQVDKNGRVQKLTTISGNPLLAAAATNGVQRWRFRPFYRNGRAEEFETQVTVDFKLPPP